MGGKIVGLSNQDLLDQPLVLCVTIGIALAFHFFGKLKGGAVVARIDFDGFAPVGDGVGRVAFAAFQKSEQLVDVIVVGGKAAGPLDSLLGNIQFALTECEHAPIGPAGWFPRRP